MQIIFIIVIVLIAYFIYVYNRLVTLKNRGSESLSDIDVQLKRRYDLIPNLVETVKGYATHEKEVFERVTQLRTEAMKNTGNLTDKAKVEGEISQSLKSLFAVAENYPELKANQNFLALQQQITDTEDKIQAARRFYNTNVLALNTALQVFPNNLVATPFGFAKMNFFEVENEEEKKNVKIGL